MGFLVLAVEYLKTMAPLARGMDLLKSTEFQTIDLDPPKSTEPLTLDPIFPRIMEYPALEVESLKNTVHQLNALFPRSMEPQNYLPGLCRQNMEYLMPGPRLLKSTVPRVLPEVEFPSPVQTLSVLPVQSLSTALRLMVPHLPDSHLNLYLKIIQHLLGPTIYQSRMLQNQPKVCSDPKVSFQLTRKQQQQLTAYPLDLPTALLQGILTLTPRGIMPLLNRTVYLLLGTCLIPMKCRVQRVFLKSMECHPVVLAWRLMPLCLHILLQGKTLFTRQNSSYLY